MAAKGGWDAWREGETKGGEEGDSTEETDSLVTDSLVTEEGGEGGITMHPSISSLGDPSMLEGEGSIVLPGEEGLVGTVGGGKPEITIPDSPLKGGGPDGMGSPQHGMESPQHGSGSPQHGPPIAKDDCVAPDKWFWGGKGKEAWWGIKSLKRRVAKIDLHENDLEGTLPGGPGTGIFPVVQPIPPEGKEEVILGHLRVLILFKNALSGPLPASYSKFTMLQHLDISHNQLSGDIPETIFDIKTLKRIHLEHNYMLTGSIPESFCDLDKLQAFTIHYNKVKGELPSNIGACKNLKEFSIHHNSMEGQIPESITELEKLERCYINNNHFAGEESALKELQERIFTAGNFKADERVGYAKPEESDDEDDEDGTGEETQDPTIDSSRHD
ncbi:hypothetical protein TrRE_jg4452 [Triparma retinervis]|uniref:Uncharacterized protein n=1 Tax=Triparma retinervis TaxID=2557542 RepID=A0A9W7G9N6_9STRA|nr:hypothetical protein TrRE_jg4452 [Triparma retinervis]